MGMSQEQWDAFVVAGDGVEIRQDGDYNAVLVVDEHEVWTDGTSEPEDMCLSRDLASFVHAIKSLAAERTKLRLDLAAAIARAERAEAGLAALRDAGDEVRAALVDHKDPGRRYFASIDALGAALADTAAAAEAYRASVVEEATAPLRAEIERIAAEREDEAAGRSCMVCDRLTRGLQRLGGRDGDM